MNRKQEILLDFSQPIWSFRTFVAGRDMRPAVIMASFFAGGGEWGYYFCRMPEINGLAARPFRTFWKHLMAGLPEVIHHEGHFLGWRGESEYFIESTLYVPVYATGEIRVAKNLEGLALYAMVLAGISENDAVTVVGRILSFKAEMRREEMLRDD